MRMQIANWIATSCLTLGALTQPVSAGQWMDSILNARRPAAYPIGAPTPVTQNYASVVANYGSYAAQPPSATGLSAIPLGVPQTVAAYMPTASYDTTWNQTPVTYYRPVTSFDPRTGTTVTSLQPCTSVQYQAQRPPMIAPRPLLGEYGMQANRWPGITGPGYNPTGLAYSANYGGYQQLPNNGYTYPVTPYQANSFPVTGAVPLGTSGSSMGMPASSLPVTSIPAYAPNALATVPTYSYPTTVAPATAYSPTVPLAPYVPTVPYATPYATSYAPYPTSQVAPAAAWSNTTPSATYSTTPTFQPATTYPSSPITAYAPQYQPSQPLNATANCANGYCAQPNPVTSGVSPSNSFGNAPNIPGATVTPLGPPTFSPSPSLNNPGLGNPSLPGSIMPPTGAGAGSGNPAGFDPESTIRPSLGSQASVQRATIDHLVSGSSSNSSSSPSAVNTNTNTNDILPKQPASNTSNDSTFAMKEIDRPSAGLLPRRDAGKISSLMDQPSTDRFPIPVPPTLSVGKPSTSEHGSAGSRVTPLEAPAGIDTRARKNPNLYDADDKQRWNKTTHGRINDVLLFPTRKETKF